MVLVRLQAKFCLNTFWLTEHFGALNTVLAKCSIVL